MDRDKLFLEHILEAIQSIEGYIEDVTFDKFIEKSLSSKKTRDAVIREFEIMGEATKNLTDKIKECDTSIDWQDIIDMRNVITHEYFGIDYEIVWETANQDLSKLKIAVTELLKK